MCIKVMALICSLKIKKEDSLKNLARKIGFSDSSSSFRNTIDILREKQFIKEEFNKKGHPIQIQINLNKLEDYVRGSSEFHFWDNFIHKTTFGAMTG